MFAYITLNTSYRKMIQKRCTHTLLLRYVPIIHKMNRFWIVDRHERKWNSSLT